MFTILNENRFVANGRRLMKHQDLMDEIEKSIEDKLERSKVLEGSLGRILSSTQVMFHDLFPHLYMHAFI